jgi:alanine racemase
VQFDTGMNRLGLEPDELVALKPIDDLNVCLVLSHLSVADDPAHLLNEAQVHQFEVMSAKFQGAERSLLNSAGLTALNGPRFDLVRNGIALFAKNVATLRARIIQVRDVAPSEVVGYGAAWTASRPSRIATVSLGYADGYDRTDVARTRRQLCPLGRAGINGFDHPGCDRSGPRSGPSGRLGGGFRPPYPPVRDCTNCRYD